MANPITLKPKQLDNGVWYVSFDGRILGDSPGYASRQAAREAALKIMDADEARHANEVRLYSSYVYRA